jgi:hypothetical protein
MLLMHTAVINSPLVIVFPSIMPLQVYAINLFDDGFLECIQIGFILSPSLVGPSALDNATVVIC